MKNKELNEIKKTIENPVIQKEETGLYLTTGCTLLDLVIVGDKG